MVVKSYDPVTMKVAAEYPFEVTVQSDADVMIEMMEWCEANCVRFWMFGPTLPIKVFETWTYFIAFQDDQDAMFFKMRWQ